MASPDKHSILGASAAERWMHCTPSARLTEDMENETSTYAEEGTAAHALCEYKVCCSLHLPHGKRPCSDYNSDVMEECSDKYCEYCTDIVETEKAAGRNPVVAVEEHVDFDDYVPGGFGQCDFLVVSKGRLHICDYKHGQGVLVQASNNPQMMLYALGALEKYDPIFEIETIEMTIFQPRLSNVSTCVMTAKELRRWANEKLRPAALLADKGEGEFSAGSWCRFCKARHTCRERADSCLKLAQLEFKEAPLLTDDELGIVMRKADELNRWCNDVYDYAQAAAIHEGKHFDGFKLVRGRSVRKFSDNDAVEKAAKEAGYTDIYSTTLITLTAFEKLMGKTKFADILGKYVKKEDGKLTLVPDSDKRPEVTVNTASDDFKED